MKTQIFAVIFGLMLSLVNVSFAQSGANYKEQFNRASTESVCTNVSNSSSVSSNYKQSKNHSQVFNSTAASAKCCNNTDCIKSECCKEGNCTKECCSNNNMRSDYKHVYPKSSNNVSEMNKGCNEHKISCCN